MLEKLFVSVVITSLVGTIFSLVLFLLKPITRKAFSASWNYYIWVCVLAVMVIPLHITLPEKDKDLFAQTIINAETNKTEVEDVIQGPFDSDIPTNKTFEEDTVIRNNPVLSKTVDLLGYIIPVASVVWAILATFIFLSKLLRYRLFIRHTLRTSHTADIPQIASKRVSARVSNCISSPLMTGVFKPVLILPDTSLSKEQIANVVCHEMTHFKRCDVLVKWFSLIVKSIHFFNPAVYYICRQLDEECEISCDAAVVKNMTKEKELSYINTIRSLLSESNSRGVPLTTGMAGSKETLKKRFLLIKNKKNASKKVVIFSVIAAIILVAIALFSGGILNGSIIKDQDYDVIHHEGAPVVFTDVYSKCVGYIENSETDYIKVYTEKNGEYVMSIPWAVVEPFPANNREDENYPFGWMEHFDIYCGKIDNFHWAVVVSGVGMGAANTNVCTSTDNGKNWYVNNTDYMRNGLVDNAWFVSENVGYISYSGGGYGKGLSSTKDGGRTWEHKMEYDMPLPLSPEDAVLMLKYQLITAYEIRYGEYIPRYDDPDPAGLIGDKERLPFIIETLRVTRDDGEYYTVPVIWDFLIEKETGQIYKFYDGLDKMLIPFDPLDENALSFAG